MFEIPENIKKSFFKLLQFLSSVFVAFGILYAFGVDIQLLNEIIQLISIMIGIFWGIPALFGIVDFHFRRIKNRINEILNDIKNISSFKNELVLLQKDIQNTKNSINLMKEEFQDAKEKIFGFAGDYHEFESLVERVEKIEGVMGDEGYSHSGTVIDRIKRIEEKTNIR